MSGRQPRAWVRVSHRTKNLHPSKKRWEVAYEDPTQNYKRRTKGGFTTKGVADKLADDFRDSTRNGTYVDPERGRHTFATVAEEYLDTTHFPKARTADGYRRLLLMNTAPTAIPATFGPLAVGEISYESVWGWVNALKASKSPTTVRNNFYALRTLLDYAVDTRRISENPARVGRFRTMRGVLPPVRKVSDAQSGYYPLSTDEAFTIISNLPYPYDVYALLAADTWCRPEELAGLWLQDVDTEPGVIGINAVVVDVNGHLIRETDPKTVKSIREIDLAPDTNTKLAAYVKAHSARALAAGYPANKLHELPLFVGLKEGRAYGRPDIERLDFTKPIRHSNFYNKYWRAATRAAGVPDSVRFYDLRHAGISLHVNRLGKDDALSLPEIQERAGHASKVMTFDRYSHAPKRDTDRIRRALSAARTPASTGGVGHLRVVKDGEAG
ncbi:hypothetical protein GCM10009789_87720 [Kribbella sancticallisti]|uniref:Tyr recombinase domain-containing protein n=1 Tax=Kribbella sancticallisti TaxID=460087 RepID=A0ABN2EX70_9ACTN